MNINKYRPKFFFEEFDVLGGGSGESESQAETQTESGEESQAGATQTQPANAFDHKALAKEFGQVLNDQFTKRDEAAKSHRQPTPEEQAQARKELNFLELSDDWHTKFGNLDTQKGAISELVEGLRKEYQTVLQAHLARQDHQWNERFEPVRQVLTQQEETARVSRFNSRYEQLANPKLQPLLHAVGNQLATQKAFDGLSESDAFDKLAKGVESVIRETNPQFSLKATTNQSGRSGNAISHQSSGSGGGGGSAGAKVDADSPNGLFGPVRGKR